MPDASATLRRLPASGFFSGFHAIFSIHGPRKIIDKTAGFNNNKTLCMEGMLGPRFNNPMDRAMKRSSLCLLVFFVVCFLIAPFSTVHAAISFSGGVSPEPTAWDSTTTGYVDAGYVTVDSGSELSSAVCYIGTYAESTGVVTVDGTGSTWTNNCGPDSNLGIYVGYNNGTGTLNITNGGAVDVKDITIVGQNGTIAFGNSGGTLTTWALKALSDQLTGTGTILTRGLIGHVNLMFDSTASLSQTLTLDDQPGQNITFHLDLASDPSSNGPLGAHCLTIRNGASVESSIGGWVGTDSDSIDVATVSGFGSKWTITRDGLIPSLLVGSPGNGILNIEAGGTVISDGGNIGNVFNSMGMVRVDGVGSTWNAKIEPLYPACVNIGGSSGTGRLRITNGGTVLCASIWLNQSFTTNTSMVLVDGTGSSLLVTGDTLTGMLGSVTMGGTTILSVTGGGSVIADCLNSLNGGFTAIDVGRGSDLTIGGGTGTITSINQVWMLAGAGVMAGETFTPISSGAWSGGTYQGVGGTLNKSTHQFTTSAVVGGTAGSPVRIDLASEQRVFVGDVPTGWNMGASFLHKTSSSTLSFTGTTDSGGTLTGLLNPDEIVLSGWELTADGAYTVGEPMYLSFDVGHAQLLDDLQVWSLEGDGWTKFDAYDLTYDRTYASWTATAMGTYAVTGKLVLDGDANRDGSTNGTDLNAVLSNYNASGNATWAMGDFNGDGSVNGSDLNAVLSNYNQSLTSATAAVPEPASIFMLIASVLAGLGWAARLRRR